jgi:peptidoglycan-N-acetylglucosamine deacetylase
MRSIFLSFLLGSALFPSILRAQVHSSYQVGTWADFKTCAISYTFDDGCANQFTKAIPIFDQFGYKLTLFTVTDWVKNWEDIQSAAKNGHEVASHTVTHSNFKQLTVAKQKGEIESSVEVIDSKVSSEKCLTMATPYCAQGSDSLAVRYFVAVRGCAGFIEEKTPKNIMNVSSVICGTQGLVKKVKDFKTKADQAAEKNGWLVYLLHGIDDDGGYSPVPSDTLKASLEYLKANDQKFWVSTFGNQAKYIRERDCVSVKENSVSKKNISVVLSDTLKNNQWYDYPLSFRRTLPAGWKSATATQNGKLVRTSIVEVNSVKYIQFDAVPDAGEVALKKSK